MARRLGAPHTRALANHPSMLAFHKAMDKLAYSRSHWEVFVDFLTLTTCCMLSDNTFEHPREKQYREIAESYDGEARKHFSELLAWAFDYMADTNRECLSELWEVYAANERLGQFFTPWCVCECMARISVGGVDWSRYSPERKCWIGDCACGGGRTLVAAAKQIPATEIGNVAFHGIDVDPNVCMVAALNLLFFNLNGVIVNGNALTLEGCRVYGVRHSILGATIEESTDPAVVKRWITFGLPRDLSEPAPEEPAHPAPPAPATPRPALIEVPEGAQMMFDF